MSKIIALLHTRNEDWILPTYLSSMNNFADEILVLDDNSTDKTLNILRNNKKVSIFKNRNINLKMSEKRQMLLNFGRKKGGTHFICLDADEAFSNNFKKKARKTILSLKPGKKLTLLWIPLWKSLNKYRNDKSDWSNSYKDFIFADNGYFSYKENFLSEDRTPGINNNKTLKKIESKKGVVLHFQFINWDSFQEKQAWYRCLELTNTNKTSSAINSMYKFTLIDSKNGLSDIKKTWIKNLILPKNKPNPWRLKEIKKMFDNYGIEYFEYLDIWHIEKLKKEFLNQKRRLPQEGVNNFIKKVYFLLKKKLLR